MSRIIVKQLPKNINENTLRNIFGTKGTITDIQLKYSPGGRFRQFAFIGYQHEQEAQEALRYFNNTCIQTNRIKVELCANLGSENKPQSWSKYSKDSKKNLKNLLEENEHKTLIETAEKLKDKKNQVKASKRLDEIIGKHKADPEFKEFIQAHSKKRLLWDNDLGEMENEKHKDIENESEEEEIIENSNNIDEDIIGSVENENEIEDCYEKLATKPINDLEYMKALMAKTNEIKNDKKKKQAKMKVETQHNLYTIKIHNVPYKVKRQDIIKFFKPLRPYSVRIPTNVRGFCYVGFKTEREMTKAMLKNKSFISGKQVFFTDFTEKNQITKLKQTNNKYNKLNGHNNNDNYEGNDNNDVDDGGRMKNSKWQQQELSLCNGEDISDSGRIFFRNLAYTVTENDLQTLFEQFGPVAELKLPIDTITRQIKGFGTVTYVMPENAVTAFNKLDGNVFHGRLLHLIPGKSDQNDNNEADDAGDEKSLTFKQKKLRKLKKSGEQSICWNTLFLGANAVAEIIAAKFNTTKEKVLDTTDGHGGSSAAVRMALGETQIVMEMKKFLEDHDVQLDVFNTVSVKRSKTIILVKNLPPNTEVEEIADIFRQFGPIVRFVLPPNGVTAIVEYCDPGEARQAFKKLAYSKFKHVPLYLEWAPENIIKNSNNTNNAPVIAEMETTPKIEINNNQNKTAHKLKIEKGEKDENGEEEEPAEPKNNVNKKIEANEVADEMPESNTTIFLRNLNFETQLETVKDHFKHLGAIHSVEIAKRRDPNDSTKFKTLGYGFIQFKKQCTAEKALKTMQFTVIDGKRVELKRSDRILKVHEIASIRRKTVKIKEQTGTKILVRNIPFQTKVTEVRDIFKTFGELRSVRLPKKLTPGETEHHRGFGFVDFVTKSDAKKAFEALCQSTHLYGRRLVLEWASLTDDDVIELRKRTAQNTINLQKSKSNKRIILKKTKNGNESDNIENDEIEENALNF